MPEIKEWAKSIFWEFMLLDEDKDTDPNGYASINRRYRQIRCLHPVMSIHYWYFTSHEANVLIFLQDLVEP